jgi:peptidyl-tRNA hydrolase, PTH2 family
MSTEDTAAADETRQNRLKMVLVVRNDLNMRKGKVGAQTGHAVQELIIDRSGPKPVLRDAPFVLDWLAADYPKPVVRVDSEAELLDVYARAQAVGLKAHLVQDLGHTEFHGVPTYTAVGIGPAPSYLIDPVTGTLKLL